jgi:hypothetical protein
LNGHSVNCSYSFIDVQFIFWLFPYKTIFGALKTLVEFGVQLGAPSCRSRYAVCQVTLWHKVNMELQLDATIAVLLISKISSTCFGQTFAHLQERKQQQNLHPRTVNLTNHIYFTYIDDARSKTNQVFYGISSGLDF